MPIGTCMQLPVKPAEVMLTDCCAERHHCAVVQETRHNGAAVPCGTPMQFVSISLQSCCQAVDHLFCTIWHIFNAHQWEKSDFVILSFLL